MSLTHGVTPRLRTCSRRATSLRRGTRSTDSLHQQSPAITGVAAGFLDALSRRCPHRLALQQTYEEKGIPSVPGSDPRDHEPGSLRTHNLSARAPVFRRIIQTPEIIACMEHLLGSDCILSDMGARSPLPGMAAQGLHRDGGPWCPRPDRDPHTVMPLVAQAMIALSEFSVATGACV